VEGLPGIPRVSQNREAEIRVIEHVEELAVDAQLHVFRQLKPLGQIQVAPEEIGTAQCVPAEIAELAILRAVAAGTGAGAGIDRETNASGLSHWIVPG
jgi:hypothetical protein